MAFRSTVVAVGTALLLSGVVAAPALADNRTSVELSDACDPVSFNQAGVSCDPRAGGDVTLQQLVAAIQKNPREVLREREVLDWEFSEDELTVRAGTTLMLKNVGGELHTFTNVGSSPTLGCVPPVNALFAGLGLPPAPDCSPAVFAATGVAAQTRRPMTITKSGVYICLIHPWMRTDIKVI